MSSEKAKPAMRLDPHTGFYDPKTLSQENES